MSVSTVEHHRVVEWFGVEGSFKCPVPCNDQQHLSSLSGCSDPVQHDPDCFRDGASAISLGHHFQCFITFIVKKNLPYMYSESPLFKFKTCSIATGTWPHLSYELPISIEKRNKGLSRTYALHLCLY